MNRYGLLDDMGPIRVADVVEDEYDARIGGIYRMLQRARRRKNSLRISCKIETVSMGLPGLPIERRLEIARRLRELDLSSDS